MSSWKRVGGGLLLLLGLGAVLIFLLQGREIAILNPAGTIATKQRNLLVFGTLLSLLIVLPVFVVIIYVRGRDLAG